MDIFLTKNEQMVLQILFEKLTSYKKEVTEHKNNLNSVMYSNTNASYSKSAKEVAHLINNLLISINSLEEVLSYDSYILNEENIIALLSFSYKHLKLTDQQLLNTLCYVIKNNMRQDGFEFRQKSFKDAHFSLKKHYFDKQQLDDTLLPLTLEDTKEIDLSLHSLGINKKVIQKLMKLINLNVSSSEIINDNLKQIKKEKNSIYRKEKIRKEETTSITAGIFKVQESEPIFSKKEYFKIINELLEYFSFDFKASNIDKINNSIIISKDIISDDRQICISLLKQAKYDISTINSFLEKTFIYNKRNLNILTFYNEIYEILNYLLNEDYESYFWLEEKLKEINNIMLEMQLADNDTYCFCKELIRTVIEDILEGITIPKMTSYYLKREKKLNIK